MEILWLECDAERGMLNGEFAVSIKTETGVVSMFVPMALVREEHGRTSIPVHLIDENEAFRLVELPQAPIDGSRAVKVKKSLVHAA